MPNFEVFDRRSKARTTAPFVTIQRKGTFSFNQAAFELLGSPKAVEFLFDRHERIIGLRPVPEDKLNAYPVRKQNNSAVYLIAGKMFCDYYNIDTKIARRYNVKLDSPGQILLIDLKQQGAEVIGPRSRADVNSSSDEGNEL